jgi:hypothetical protein
LATKLENMILSAEQLIEILMIYGGQNIGVAPLQDVGTPTTSLTFSISTATWATGIWAGMENALIVFSLAADNTAVDTLKPFQISAVDVDAREITVVVPTGFTSSIANLETAIEANALNINFYGAVSGSAGTFAYKEMNGLYKQITNTSSLFGIDAGTYDLWRGNTVATSGQLTMAKVLSSVSKAFSRGLRTDATLLCNPLTWADLNSNLAALRRFDGSYSRKKAENGSEEIAYTSMNGSIKIVPYSIIKEGDAFIYPDDRVIRIGARDLSLNNPVKDQNSREIFFDLPTQAGVGVRAYTNQAIFLEAPAQAVYISGIVNSVS